MNYKQKSIQGIAISCAGWVGFTILIDEGKIELLCVDTKLISNFSDRPIQKSSQAW